jgi:hypothetical protein
LSHDSAWDESDYSGKVSKKGKLGKNTSAGLSGFFVNIAEVN